MDILQQCRISTSHLQSQSDAKNLFSVVFELFPWLSIVQKRLVELLLIILQALAFDSDLRVMPLILCFRFFLAVQSEVCLQR